MNGRAVPNGRMPPAKCLCVILVRFSAYGAHRLGPPSQKMAIWPFLTVFGTHRLHSPPSRRTTTLLFASDVLGFTFAWSLVRQTLGNNGAWGRLECLLLVDHCPFSEARRSLSRWGQQRQTGSKGEPAPTHPRHPNFKSVPLEAPGLRLAPGPPSRAPSRSAGHVLPQRRPALRTVRKGPVDPPPPTPAPSAPRGPPRIARGSGPT